MKTRELAIKMSAMYLFLFLGLACTYPYLTLFLQYRGLNNTQIGLAYAILNIGSVLSQPIWGFMTDRYSNKRTVLIIMALLNAAFIINFIFADRLGYVLFCILLMALFQSSLIPITDAFCYDVIERYKTLQYGKLRVMGSIGYAIGSLILGGVIKATGINTVFYAYIVLMLILAFNFYMIPAGNKGAAIAGGLRFGDTGEVFKNKRLIILLLTVMFGSIAMGSNGTYITVLIQKTGGDASQLGMMWFFLGLSQIPVMFWGAKLIKRYGELNLYIVAMFLFAVRFFLNSICTTYTAVIVVQMLDSITFTVYFVAVLDYLNKVTSAKLKTLAMTLFAAANGVGTLVGNVSGGRLIDAAGIFVFYKCLAAICLACMMLVVMLKRYDKRAQSHEA